MMSFWDEEMEQSRAKGRAEGRVEVVHRMLAVQLPVNQISELTGLTFSEIDALRKNELVHLAKP